MRKTVIVSILVLFLLVIGAGSVFAKDSMPNGLALGLGYTSNPYNSRWVGGIVTFHIPKLPIMFEASPYIGYYGFGTSISGDWWLINEKISGILNWYLGPGVWLDFGFGSSFNLGLGGRVAVGLQAWVMDQLELFIEAAPGIGLYFLPSIGFAWPVPISLGGRWWF